MTGLERGVILPFVGISLWGPIVLIGFYIAPLTPSGSLNGLIIGTGVLCFATFMASFIYGMKLIDRAYQ